MEDKDGSVESLLDRAEAYGKTSFELYKLKAVDKVAGVGSTLVSRAARIFVLTMLIVNVNVAAGLWLGELLGKTYFGFLCVAGFYFIVWFILYVFMKKWITRRYSNSIISKMLN